jgi:hypothetical protein
VQPKPHAHEPAVFCNRRTRLSIAGPQQLKNRKGTERRHHALVFPTPNLPIFTLGVVYASVEGVNEHSYDECLEHLVRKGEALGATALVALQLTQSQFQWNQRTSLMATAMKEG